jgi:phosphinothricin acetyltransferase
MRLVDSPLTPASDPWPDLRLRRGAVEDLAALTELYNHYIAHTPISFDLEPFTIAQRQPWFSAFGSTGRHQIFVAEAAGRLLGYACSHGFRPKAAYATSVETSVYCAPEAVGKGLGRRLYDTLFEALASEDVHRAYAGVTLPNPASVGLHETVGFRKLAVYTEVGRKFGRYWDVLWLEKRFEAR